MWRSIASIVLFAWAAIPNESNNAFAQSSTIVWETKRLNTTCFDLRWAYPASLVPVLDPGAATGGETTWHSQDDTISLTLNTQRILNPAMDKRTYLDEASCKSYSVPKNRLYCKQETNKFSYMEQRKDDICGFGRIIAPDPKDQSRFAVELMICGPKAARDSIATASDQIFRSLSMTYKGCCQNGKYFDCKEL